ncbi:type III-A CRISPR-associated RAMP protein Csm4 [Tolypothrix sp. VBCCA 56010]|uniref:type III-A CRISPR-associated RAMP protein Csm4 n=1 Tax=Tolypothrix sp. VBCCA 56010 TaxID=3137731 RepID=UPI003D7D664C
MTTWKLVKLNFGRSPVHFGELGIGMEESKERVRSDTLFSAWVTAYARLFGKEAVEKLLQEFQQNTPVRMSSTFIYREVDKRTIFYLPRPLKFPINYPKDNDLAFFKTYKGLNYLPLEIWQRWYQTEGFSTDDSQELIDRTNKKDGTVTALKNAGTFDYKTAFSTDKVPKIAVDRVTRATNLYHTGFVQYHWEQNGKDVESLSGLYFLLQIERDDKQLITQLQHALEFLGEQGIGGERTSGAGQFKVQWLELPKIWQSVTKFSDTSAHQCLLSMFWDNDQAILQNLITANSSSYEIQERGGWLAESNIRRQMVRMFTEGSVFPKQPHGKLIDVTPSEFKRHKIYRSGISFSLAIKVQI